MGIWITPSTLNCPRGLWMIPKLISLGILWEDHLDACPIYKLAYIQGHQILGTHFIYELIRNHFSILQNFYFLNCWFSLISLCMKSKNISKIVKLNNRCRCCKMSLELFKFNLFYVKLYRFYKYFCHIVFKN